MDIDAQSAAGQRPPAWSSYAEQRLYEVSPLGILATTMVLYLILIGTYALAAAVDQHAWIVPGRSGPEIDRRAWIALCLSLIVCVVLGLQRYNRLAELSEGPAFARAVNADVELMPPFSASRLRLLAMVGGAAAAAAMLWFLTFTAAGRDVGVGLTLWFCAVAALLGALFARGVELTGATARHNRQILQHGLAVDLLRIERLHPFGRAAARTAAIWFSVSAASLLLFVGADMAPAMVALSAVSAAIGVWVFFGTIGRIREAIRAAKAAELETLRHEIALLKARIDADPAAAPKLQSLLAFEARIAAVREWPFDQSTAVRVAASSLVLALPWFGQAFAGALVERLGGMIR